MSAQDRLAATLAKHYLMRRPKTSRCAGCAWTWGPERVVEAHAAHVAAVIASSDDLAVIELEAPRRRRDSYSRPIKGWLPWKRGVVHVVPEGMAPREGRYEGAYMVRYDDQRGGGTVYTPKSAREFAAALLAAVKAAEAVSDRA